MCAYAGQFSSVTFTEEQGGEIKIMNARQGNLVSGIVALGLVAFIFYFSEDMPSTAAAFPRFIAILLLVASLILIVRAIMDRRPQANLFADLQWSTVAILGGTWIVTIFVIEQLGFIVPGTAFILLGTWVLSGKPKDAKSLAKIAVFAVGMLAAYWAIFHLLLNISSPAPGGRGIIW